MPFRCRLRRRRSTKTRVDTKQPPEYFFNAKMLEAYQGATTEHHKKLAKKHGYNLVTYQCMMRRYTIKQDQMKEMISCGRGQETQLRSSSQTSQRRGENPANAKGGNTSSTPFTLHPMKILSKKYKDPNIHRGPSTMKSISAPMKKFVLALQDAKIQPYLKQASDSINGAMQFKDNSIVQLLKKMKELKLTDKNFPTIKAIKQVIESSINSYTKWVFWARWYWLSP